MKLHVGKGTLIIEVFHEPHCHKDKCCGPRSVFRLYPGERTYALDTVKDFVSKHYPKCFKKIDWLDAEYEYAGVRK